MRPSNWILLVALSSPLLASSARGGIAGGRLPVVEDDYPRARALAVERKLPLFVDVWAPW